CKWRRKKLGTKILNELKDKAEKFVTAKEKYFGFFSKSGFSKEMIQIAKENDNIFLFDYFSD
ncbi:MAG: hypothetical protein J7L03_04875, partial [Caldisericaceae bacterium]|nr:hypothetical protein [Caldisericaceae bacterium]